MEKQHVALVKRACRICNNTEDAEILLVKDYKRTFEGIEPLHDLKEYQGQVIGFLEGGKCKECIEKYKDKIVFIVIDPTKTEDFDNPWKTGKIGEIPADCEFGKHLIDTKQVKNNLAYISETELEKLTQKK